MTRAGRRPLVLGAAAAALFAADLARAAFQGNNLVYVSAQP
jgi:hypothetical protein